MSHVAVCREARPRSIYLIIGEEALEVWQHNVSLNR